MSGRKQHYIPKFLLKGFNSRSTPKPIYSWVFKNGIIPYEANIESIGAERDFYADSNDQSADEFITLNEIKYSQIMEMLRNDQLEQISPNQLATFLSHLQGRTKWFRDVFSRHTTSLVFRLMAYMKSDEYMDRFIDAMFSHGYSHINDSIDKNMAFYKKNKISKNQARKLMLNIIRTRRNDLKRHLQGFIEGLEFASPDIFDNAIRIAHINSQKQIISEGQRIAAYEDLKYRVVKSDECTVLLGDCVIISVIDTEAKYTGLWSSDNELQGIILPLTSNSYLIGQRSIHDIETQEINMASASLSDLFFVSSRNTDYEFELANLIGQKSFLFSENDLDIVATEIMRENNPVHIKRKA